MTNPDILLDRIAEYLLYLPQLSATFRGRIEPYHDNFPDNTYHLLNVLKLDPPSISIVWQGYLPEGEPAGSAGHQISIYLRPTARIGDTLVLVTNSTPEPNPRSWDRSFWQTSFTDHTSTPDLVSIDRLVVDQAENTTVEIFELRITIAEMNPNYGDTELSQAVDDMV